MVEHRSTRVVSDARARTLAGFWADEGDQGAPLAVLARTGAITSEAVATVDALLQRLAPGDSADPPRAAPAQLNELVRYMTAHGPRGPVQGWGAPHDNLLSDAASLMGWTLANSDGLPSRLLGSPGSPRLPHHGIWLIDPAHSSINFSATHLKMSRVRGFFASFDGSFTVDEPLTSSAVVVDISTASISTGVQMRDDHLRSGDFLDVQRYPSMVFASERLERVGDGWRMPGELTVRDITRPVTLDVQYLGVVPDPDADGERAGFTASTRVSREDFNLTWNRPLPMGQILIGSLIDIELNVVASDRALPDYA